MISIIIPNFNQQRFIQDAIESALAQTYHDYEILIIDDGSTDESKTIIDGFGDKIKYIWQENKGLAGARNTGIKAAKGDYVAFLDADDIWLPTYLETMQDLITQHPEGAIYYCCAQCIDDNGNRLPQIVGEPFSKKFNKNEMYQTLLRANYLIPSTITARKDVIIQAGLFDDSLRYCEDIDLWLRTAADHFFVGTDSCQVLYRIHSSSLSTNPQKTQQTKLQVIEKHFGPDDENWEAWSADKKRAFGGAYRFQTITSIQNADDWDKAGISLRKAILSDPTLATDLDLFYEIGLGSQKKGLRTNASQMLILENSNKVNSLLVMVFSLDHPKLQRYKSETFGTAYYAVGLLSYNNGLFNIARRFLWKSITINPKIILDSRFMGTFIRAISGRKIVNFFKSLRSQQTESINR